MVAHYPLHRKRRCLTTGFLSLYKTISPPSMGAIRVAPAVKRPTNKVASIVANFPLLEGVGVGGKAVPLGDVASGLPTGSGAGSEAGSVRVASDGQLKTFLR
jgi:hypothetical protein